MIPSWITGRRVFEVPCTVELEQTPASLHAHVDLDGIEVGPGDSVRVHSAPTRVGFGQRLVCQRRATVVRAGWLGRLWVRAIAPFELTELYEVSFTSRRRL
jgi:hypothetical protein